jgi:hypothetical protein
MNKNINKIREQIVNELHKPAQKKFLRKPVKILGIDDLWQADLTILDAFSKVNSGYKYLLVVIDCFSKFAWVKKLKTKSGPEQSPVWILGCVKNFIFKTLRLESMKYCFKSPPPKFQLQIRSRIAQLIKKLK